MKIALCLHGLVGSIKGKNYEMLGGGDEVLKKSFIHNRNILDRYDVDTFVHSWSTELENEITEMYSPKKSLIEDQIEFQVPSYIKSDYSRAFAHLSRWYSYKKVIELLREYEKTNQTEYDFVLVQRFDLVWNLIPLFEIMDPNKFYVGKSTLNPNREWSDRWFISNPNNMEKFATLYDQIPEYMGPGGGMTSDKMWRGISSHFLVKYHASKLGLIEEFLYNFGGGGHQPNDYNEVRRQYYG